MADIRTLTEQVVAVIDNQAIMEGPRVSRLPGVILLRHVEPTPLASSLYEPVVCLILQGRKQTTLGETCVRIGPGQSLVVSHDLPVVSRITRATPSEPYLAVIVTLDLALLRGLYDEVAEMVDPDDDVSALAVHRADEQFVDSVSRYLALSADAIAARVLGPQIRREIHFRLLMAPHGGMLRRLLRHDSSASSVARAIARIRREFRSSISVPELAREIGMSQSSFHKHFKAITATTPLQYQKDLRLLEARRLLSAGEHNVTSVAFHLGYESPNQFSREYARKFGVPPRRDLAAVSA